MEKFLSHDGWIVCNKWLVKKIGFLEAGLLGEICSKKGYWIEHDGLDEEGYFYNSYEDFSEVFNTSIHLITKAIEHLEEYNFIKTKLKGLPRKKYYKVNDNLIYVLQQYSNDIDSNKSTTQISINQRDTFIATNEMHINNNKDNNNKDNNDILLSKDNNTTKVDCHNVIDNTHIPIFDNNKENIYISAESGVGEQPANTSTAEPKKKTGASLIYEYISTLDFNDTSKDYLKKWYKDVMKYQISIEQLKEKLQKLSKDADNDVKKMDEAIYNAYINGYRGFFVSKQYKQQSTSYKIEKPMIENKKPNEPDGSYDNHFVKNGISVSNEEF